MHRFFAPIAVTTLLLAPCLSQAGTPANAAESSPTGRSDSALVASAGARAATPAAKPKVAKPALSDASSTQSDQARYADREQASGEAKEFRGGDTVVIGASAATAILAVLLLIILI